MQSMIFGMPYHRYKYLWRKCLEPEIIAEAWALARKGKARRSEVAYIEEHFDACIIKMREMLFNTRPDGDPNKAFYPVKHKPKFRYEFGKVRETYCPTMWEQWMHHIVILVIKPIMLKFFYKYSCGSVPKKGSIYGKRYIERIIRKKRFKYYAKLDIRHFFQHVGIEYVINELKIIIQDEWYFYLIRRVFEYFPNRLPLGFYPSQWFCNFVLCRMDWKIKHKLPIAYCRYVDDMFIAYNNKKVLHVVIRSIMRYIGSSLHLKIKENWQVIKNYYRTVYRIDRSHKIHKIKIGRPLDFMGFVFYRTKTIIRKSTFYRACRFSRHLGKQKVWCIRQALSMISRLGPFKNTNTKYAIKKYILPYISVKKLKDIIRKYQWRYRHDNRMDKREIFERANNVCKDRTFDLAAAS